MINKWKGIILVTVVISSHIMTPKRLAFHEIYQIENRSVQPLLYVRIPMHITKYDHSKNYLQLTFISYPLVCKALIFSPVTSKAQAGKYMQLSRFVTRALHKLTKEDCLGPKSG